MALDGVLQTGLWNEAYNKQQAAVCGKQGNSLETYNGIYACGLVRFNNAGLGIVPLWRAMMEVAETNGEVYSARMIDAIVLKQGGAPRLSMP